MKKHLRGLIFLLGLALVAEARGQSTATENSSTALRRRTPTVAVLSFTDASTDAKQGGFGRIVSAMLGTHLRNETNFVVAERAKLYGVIDEKQYSELGLTGEVRERLRSLLAVEVLLTGDVSVLGELVQIDARLISTSTGEVVVADFAEASRSQDLREAVRRLSKSIEQKYLRQWMGDVKIISFPVEAEVYLDGAFIGKSSLAKPLQIRDLLEGEYTLRMIAGGYQMHEQPLQIKARALREVEISLRSLPGSLRIKSEPTGAMVILNGKDIGITPLRLDTVTEGEYRLGMRLDNFLPWSRTVQIRSGQLSEVDARLEVIPGSILVQSVPSGAQVSVGKNLAGSTPLLLENFTPGSVAIEVQAKGYETFQSEAMIRPGEQVKINAELRRESGSLTMVSEQSGVEAILMNEQGTEISRSSLPLHKLSLESGNYRLLFKKDRHFSQRHEIIVRPNTEVRKEVVLEPKPGILVFQGESEADIYIKGVYQGKSPGMELAVPEGKHQVVLASWGKVQQKELEVKSDERIIVHHRHHEGQSARLDPFYSQTIYGSTGMAFVPNGWVGGPRNSLSITGDFSESGKGLYPRRLAFRTTWWDERLELALSNTSRSMNKEGYSLHKKDLLLLPSFKWALDHHALGKLHWGYAAGFNMPYGAFFMSSASLRTPLLQPEISLGLSMLLQRGYGLASASLRLADLQGRSLPVALFAEGAWAGSTNALGETEEGFISGGFNIAFGGNMLFQGVYRRDPKVYRIIENDIVTDRAKPNQNTSGQMALRLVFRFDGVKNEGGAQ